MRIGGSVSLHSQLSDVTTPHVSADLSPTLWRLVGSSTLAAPAASISIASIPTGYKFFKVVFSGKHNGAALSNVRMRFNNDAGNNYGTEQIAAQGATITGGSGAGTSSIVCGSLTQNAGSEFDTFEMTISNQAVSYKTCFGMSGYAGLYLEISCGVWSSNTEINRIDVFVNSGDSFVAGTSVRIYGIA